MSRLADNLEAVQPGTSCVLSEEAAEALDNQDTSLDDMRHLVKELTGALRDVYRVAMSRGHLRATSYPRESAYWSTVPPTSTAGEARGSDQIRCHGLLALSADFRRPW